MTDFEELLVVLIAIYLLECCLWVPCGAVAFVSTWCGGCVVWHPSARLGNQRGGLVLLNPFRPFGFVAVCRQWPISLTAKAAYSYVAQAINPTGFPLQVGRRVALLDVRSVSCETGAIRINGQLFAQFGDDITASYFATVLANLVQTTEKEREAAIGKTLLAATDVAAIRARVAAYRHQSVVLCRWCSALLVAALLLLGAVRLYELRGWWPLFAALYLVALGGLLKRFYLAHRELLPGAVYHRWRTLSILLLSPMSAIRACSALSRYLLPGSHPLAAAIALCSPTIVKPFARRVLLDVRHPMHPICMSDDPTDVETERVFRERLCAALESLLVQSGYDLDELTQPPFSHEPSSLSYCPRCDVEYTVADGSCAACGGIPLRRLNHSAEC